jgi:fatty acid/phospholipid biosynthesis enzyme
MLAMHNIGREGLKGKSFRKQAKRMLEQVVALRKR